MSNRTVISLLGAALLVSAATGAHADGAKKVTDFSVRAEPVAVSPQGTKSLKWDARAGRWGVTLNLDQPTNRDAQLNDIQAGAYFRVTPSLRIGGAVALGEQPGAPAYKKTEAQDGAPRVRLETAFKF
jgi:hypothetical protein